MESVYEQGGKLFGKITSLTEPNNQQGKPKICIKCAGAEKDKPIVGLVILKDLSPSGEHYKGGTILDPEDGKIYNAETWVENGQLKVRGYVFFARQGLGSRPDEKGREQRAKSNGQRAKGKEHGAENSQRLS